MTKEIKMMKSEEFLKGIEFLLILVCIILLVIIVKNFFLAYHSVDTVYNGVRGYGQNALIDIGSDFTARPLEDYYIPAMQGLRNNFIYGMIDMLFLGLLLSSITNDIRPYPKG